MNKTKNGKTASAPEKTAANNTHHARHDANLAPEKLMLLITVVNRSKTEYYQDLIQSFNCNCQFSSYGRGTASGALNLLTPDNEKDIIFSLLTQENAKRALETIETKFSTIRGGKGVSFTVPITSTIGVLIYRFLCNIK